MRIFGLSLMLRNAKRHRDNPAFVDDLLNTVENAVGRMDHLLAQLRDPGKRDVPPTETDVLGIIRSIIEERSSQLPIPTLLAGTYSDELVVLLGKSGSGKTTLLNLLSGIDSPTAGDVLVGGVALASLSERERTLFRRRSIGFVFQFYNLIPTLTVEENLLLPLELKGPVAARGRARARDLLAAVGLADRRASFPERLSGGERQRVAIARALVHEPELVLADEPTGNLDAETGMEVLDLLDRLTRREGRTMVMATHSHEVIGVADRILRIEAGRLVEQGRQP